MWESPTPLRTSYVAIAGDLASTFWTLDALGNVVRHASDVTEYEIIPTPSRAPAALTSCKLGSRLYAVGPHGSVYKRGFGAWAEENVGADVNLIAAQCDGNLAMALVYKTTTLVLCFAAAMTPVLCAILMPISSAALVLHTSVRMQRARRNA